MPHTTVGPRPKNGRRLKQRLFADAAGSGWRISHSSVSEFFEASMVQKLAAYATGTRHSVISMPAPSVSPVTPPMR